MTSDDAAFVKEVDDEIQSQTIYVSLNGLNVSPSGLGDFHVRVKDHPAEPGDEYEPHETVYLDFSPASWAAFKAYVDEELKRIDLSPTDAKT